MATTLQRLNKLGIRAAFLWSGAATACVIYFCKNFMISLAEGLVGTPGLEADIMGVVFLSIPCGTMVGLTLNTASNFNNNIKLDGAAQLLIYFIGAAILGIIVYFSACFHIGAQEIRRLVAISSEVQTAHLHPLTVSIPDDNPLIKFPWYVLGFALYFSQISGQLSICLKDLKNMFPKDKPKTTRKKSKAKPKNSGQGSVEDMLRQEGRRSTNSPLRDSQDSRTKVW